MSGMHAAGRHPATDEAQGAGNHGAEDGAAAGTGPGHEHDDHTHPGEALGSLDLGAWGAGVLGVAIGLVMTFCFILATA